MKLHCGCGTIYLSGYVNIDACPDYLAKNAPLDILEQNTTTFDKYYKHSFGGSSNKIIADYCCTLDSLPFQKSSVEEVVMIHVFEHFPKYVIEPIMSEINRVLSVGGKLIIGVPDTIGNAKLLLDAKTEEEEEWAIRLIDGTQKNRWSHHYCSYTNRSLRKALHHYGFDNFSNMENINCYPAIYMEAIKVNDYGNKEE